MEQKPTIDISQTTFLSISKICDLLDVSRSTFDRWRKGENTDEKLNLTLFPEPTLYVGGAARWDVAVVNAWLEENRDKKHQKRPRRGGWPRASGG